MLRLPIGTPLTLMVGALVGVVVTPAAAHPHVFVDALVTPIFDEGGRFTAVHEVWTFDADFTTGIGPDLDVNEDGLLEPEEIRNAPARGVLWFVDTDYFTRITLGGQLVEHGPVDDFVVKIPGDRMVAEFTLPLATPEPITTGAGIDVFDPTVYVDVEFANPGVDTSEVPAVCEVTKRTTPNLDPVAAMIIRQLGLPADPAVLADPASGFAFRLAIDCK